MIYEALVKIDDNINNSLSEEDQERFLWKRGDVVTVKPKGWKWGRNEVKEFAIVELPPDFTEEDVALLEAPFHAVGLSSLDASGSRKAQIEIVCRSRFCINLDAMLGRTEESPADVSRVRSNFEDKSIEFQPLKDCCCIYEEIIDKKSNSRIAKTMRDCKTKLREKGLSDIEIPHEKSEIRKK